MTRLFDADSLLKTKIDPLKFPLHHRQCEIPAPAMLSFSLGTHITSMNKMLNFDNLMTERTRKYKTKHNDAPF